MRERDDRHAHAGHAPDLGREHAARVDHDLGLDRRPTRSARRARAPPRSTSIPVTRVCVKTRAAALARALGQRVGQLRRVEVAVGRQVGGAAHAVGDHQREQLAAPRLAEISSSGSPNVFAQATWRSTSCSRSGVQARRMPPHCTQPQSSVPVELDRVHHHAASATRSSAADRRAPPSGRSSRSSARCARAARRRARRAARGGRRSRRRRRRRR